MKLVLLAIVALISAGCADGRHAEKAAGNATARAVAPADLVFLSGAVYTVAPEAPWARAVAVRAGFIVAVGSDAEVRFHIGPETRVVELAGRMLLPGFHDAHMHPVSAGLAELECALSDLPSVDAVLSAVEACARSSNRRGEWLVGSNWSVTLFEDGNAPKELLDEIARDVPIALTDANGHAVWVNSKGLALAGIDATTPNPPAGVIERDSTTGEPSGTLRESAAELVYRTIPPPLPEQVVKGARLAVARLHRAGVTSVVDASVGERQLRAYAELSDRGELDLRVLACIGAGSGLTRASREAMSLIERREDYRRPNLDPGCVKIIADGVLEGETAALLEPYVGRPGYRGEPTFSDEELRDLVTRFDAQGLQIHVHAIGDAAVRSTLDAFEAARATNPGRERRDTIAHLQLIDPVDIPRFAKLGVIANFQPLWAFPDPYVTELNLPVIGPQRMRAMYPIASVQRAGGRLVLGTDWNVTPPDALPGIEVGLLREDPTGAIEGVLDEEERLDLPTLLAAYTANGAYLMHDENETGSIEVGKAADLVVLERNLFEIPPDEVGEVRVIETFVNGRSVFAATPGL